MIKLYEVKCYRDVKPRIKIKLAAKLKASFSHIHRYLWVRSRVPFYNENICKLCLKTKGSFILLYSSYMLFILQLLLGAGATTHEDYIHLSTP
jgi:hypothetical protein